jgi:hypothetical protein
MDLFASSTSRHFLLFSLTCIAFYSQLAYVVNAEKEPVDVESIQPEELQIVSIETNILPYFGRVFVL